MSLLALLLLLLLLTHRGNAVVDEGGSESQACVAIEGGRQHCAPTMIGNNFQLPASGTVIHAIVDNGPLLPADQTGYEITIDAGGLATTVVIPAGAAESLGDRRTAEAVVVTADLGIGGLQQLLRELYGASFFFLPTADEIDPADVPARGGASSIEVTLADGAWTVSGRGLTAEERSGLDAAQALVLTAVGLDPDDPIGSAVPSPRASA